MSCSDPDSGRGAWSDAVLRTRISDMDSRLRFEAGSPNDTEIGAYRRGLAAAPSSGLAVNLGMTPELRRLALDRFARVLTVERSAEAIALYRDWVTPESRDRETILHADWFELAPPLAEPAVAILGDGVFGNLPDLKAHRDLLSVLSARLATGAPLVVRKAVIPRGFDADRESFAVLIERHRRGGLDEAEFGFGARLLGHHRESYDPDRYILHNAISFRSCERRLREGRISEQEWQAIHRYYFDGDNCILPQDLWEQTLRRAGFDFTVHRCEGRDWYRYYPVYECRRAGHDGNDGHGIEPSPTDRNAADPTSPIGSGN